MPELRGKISVDTSDLNRGEARVREFESTLQNAFRRTREHRARSTIETGIERLASGDVTGAIEGITARLSSLGLIGGAAIGLVAVGLNKAYEASKELNAALEEGDKILGKSISSGASLSALSKDLDATAKAYDKIANAPWYSKLFSPRSYAFADVNDPNARGGSLVAKERQELSDRFAKNLDFQVDKSRQLADLALLDAAGQKAAAEAMKARIEMAEKLFDIESAAQTMRDQANKGPEGSEQAQQLAAIDAWEAHQKEITRTTAERVAQLKTLSPILEKARLSGKEISGGAGTLTDRLLMQQAAKAEEMGMKFRQQGFVSLAAEQFAISERYKAQISGLKESEKMPEFALKTAIDSATVFQDIIQELQKISQGVGEISFKNQ